MASPRPAFIGVWNIIRFNWQFYMVASLLLLFLGIGSHYIESTFQIYFYITIISAMVAVLISLVVSFYIYDFSGLYSFLWMDKLDGDTITHIININAGFDETSEIIHEKFPKAALHVLDFYDPKLHTEISIKRARKVYPPYPGTVAIPTNQLPYDTSSIDYVFVIFAAHEIRDNEERITFFKELKRILKPTGKIMVTEHVRDLPNSLAYHFGVFHFHSSRTWLNTFSGADLQIVQKFKHTPFITNFILTKNGNSY